MHNKKVEESRQVTHIPDIGAGSTLVLVLVAALRLGLL